MNESPFDPSCLWHYRHELMLSSCHRGSKLRTCNMNHRTTANFIVFYWIILQTRSIKSPTWQKICSTGCIWYHILSPSESVICVSVTVSLKRASHDPSALINEWTKIAKTNRLASHHESVDHPPSGTSLNTFYSARYSVHSWNQTTFIDRGSRKNIVNVR